MLASSLGDDWLQANFKPDFFQNMEFLMDKTSIYNVSYDSNNIWFNRIYVI